jgi:alkaline phosphatase D
MDLARKCNYSIFLIATILFSIISCGDMDDFMYEQELALDEQADPLINFLWSGGVTENAAKVTAQVSLDTDSVRLVLGTGKDLVSPTYSDYKISDSIANNRVVTFDLASLEPNTQYYYGLEIDNNAERVTNYTGKFKTVSNEPMSFSFAFGACSKSADGSVYNTIANDDILFFLHTGDLHYSDIGSDNINRFRSAYENQLSGTDMGRLFKNTPMAYMWDDHDYGPNNSDATAPGRNSSRLAYQQFVPHYPLDAGSGDVPIYQSFNVGRVLFILTDNRSERTYYRTNSSNKTVLGSQQKAWFKNKLLEAQDTYPLIVWVNTFPWISEEGEGDDGWEWYQEERNEIANFIVDNDIKGLCMLSGDAHMIAIDDGTNSNYSDADGQGFPVFHAGALSRSGSEKGGPYSHGAFPGSGQYGLMSVEDQGGNEIKVEWSGRNLSREMIKYSFDVKAN